MKSATERGCCDIFKYRKYSYQPHSFKNWLDRVIYFQIALIAGLWQTGLSTNACEATVLYFSLGDFVTHPEQPDWGRGQIQSIVGTSVTVNFEHAGKQMINCEIIHLVKVTGPKRD